MSSSRSFQNLPPPKPFKVWSCDRQKRKSILAKNLNELKLLAAEKLDYNRENFYNYKLVLELDGTEIEDDSYLQSLEKDTIILLLLPQENWLPPGMDSLKSALQAIPQIVCDTINSLKLTKKTPTWSIKDDQGFITVTLQWEHHKGFDPEQPPSTASSTWKLLSSTHQPFQSSYAAQQYGDKIYSSTFPRPSSSSQSSYKKQKSYELYLRNLRRQQQQQNTTTLPLTTTTSFLNKTCSMDDFSFLDKLDNNYNNYNYFDLLTSSTTIDLNSYCDFHCSSLHRDGGSIKVSRTSVGTSPILDLVNRNIISPTPTKTVTTAQIPKTTTSTQSATSSATSGAKQLAQIDGGQQFAQTSKSSKSKGHVRFMDIEKSLIETKKINNKNYKQNISLMELINGGHDIGPGGGGSGPGGNSETESETEETETTTEQNDDDDDEDDDDEQYCERYLLLVDQLQANNKKHLTIKDIGIILERLKSKIIDIDKLERDKENFDCYNWLIKAVIKGDMLREVGVIYNGQYYSLMEHPGFF